MPNIKLTPNEFADITITFLLDALMEKDGDVLPNHDEFQYVMKRMERAGLKTHFLHMYLNMKPLTRGKYKKLKSAFTDKASGGYNIHINGNEKDTDQEEPEGLTKSLIKKSIKMIKSHKSQYGSLITEDTLDKIIDKVMKDD